MKIQISSLLLLCCFLLMLPLAAFADQGTADAAEIMWTDADGSPSIDFDWTDIRGATSVFGSAFDDSLSGPISLPFTFSFYDTNRTQVWISSNGWISFVDPGDSTYADNTSIPGGAGANHMLAPYWDDLVSSPGNSGGVYYSTVGTSPNRKFIVQWHVITGSPTPDTLHFQVQLFEHSNLIKFQYLTVNPAFSGGLSATIGIKATTSLGNQYSFNSSASVADDDAILFHNSAVSQAAASISPGSVQIGEFVTFQYIINSIEPASDNGMGKLDRIDITNPFTGSVPSVTGVKINNAQAFIQNASGKPDNPGFANWSYSGNSLTIETAHFDVIDSIRISFSQLIPQVSTGSYNFPGSLDAQLDLSTSFSPSSTPSVNVTAGGLSYIILRSDANGSGSEVTTATISADESLTVHAAGYDAADNFIGDQLASWSTTGSLDGPNASNQSSYTFSPVLAPATGSIIATVGGTISDATGTITVNPGNLDYLIIRSAPDNGGDEVNIVEITTDDSYTFYAAGYDADNNYRGDEDVNWTSTLGISGSGISITYSPTEPDTGTVTATSGSISDVTGEIRVTGGVLSKLIVRDAPNNNGTEVGARTLTADQSITLYAAGYDQHNNYIGDQSVDWTVTGTLDGPNTSNQGSYTFSPVLAPSSGSIYATSGGISDPTGTITVNPGSLDDLTIRSAPNNGGEEVGIVNLTTDDSYTFYAAGYDADGNYRGEEDVEWTSTLGIGGGGTSITFSPSQPDTGTVTATSGSFSDVTGDIRVTTGVLDFLVIRDDADGNGNVVDDRTLTTDQSLTLYAAGYDSDTNFIGDQNVDWTVTGTLGASGATNQSSYIFSPAVAPATGTIIISSGSINDATGTFTVNPGILDDLIIRSAPNNGGSEVDIVNLSTDDSFTFYAAGYDADGNYRTDEDVTWTSTLGIGGSGPSITYTPTVPDTGTVTATSGLISDVTGEIRVTSGTLDRLVIRDAPNGSGSEVSDRSITADDSLVLYAAGYDESNNYIGDQIVDWSVTGSLDGGDLLASSTYTFDPALAPASGSFIISSGGVNDATGTISVTVGALADIRINESDAAGSDEFLGATLTTDQSITLYGAGYDSDGNYRSAESVTWSSTGTLDPVSGTSTSYTFSPVTAPSSGFIVATSGSFSDSTALIDVIEGALDYLVIRTAPGGAGFALVDTAITADDTLSLWAAGYDGNNNYLNDFSVEWVTTGTLDDVTTTSVQFNFSPATAPTSGTIIASSGSISDFTGTISVAVGILSDIRINSSSGAGGVEVNTVSLNAGQSLTLYASGYDSDGNYRSAVSPTWSSTGNLDSVGASGSSYTFTPVTAPTSGTIVATIGEISDATGIITVEEGDLASIQIRTASGGEGVVVGDTSITADETLTLYAAAYDANNNYLNDVSVNWTRTGSLDQVLASGSNYTFNPVTAPTSGTIVATSGELNTSTGTISVTQGILASVRINNTSGSGGTEVGEVSLTADEFIVLYAAGYDADGNYRSLINATWSRIGNLDEVNASGTSYTFSPVTAPTAGNIIATFSTFNDATGSITVSPGDLNSIRINSGSGPGAPPIGDVTLTVGESLDLYAAGYDAEGNERSEPVSAQWSTTGSLDLFGETGTSVTFIPQTANTAGTIIATFSSLIDETGTITVNEGSLAYLQIRTAPNGGGSVFTTASITADESLTVYTAAYDAGDNFLFSPAATWSSTGSLDAVSATDSVYVFNPVSAPTSGTLTISYEGENAATELITVSPGLAASLVDPTGQNGSRTTVAGSTQLIRVRVEDQHGNPVSQETVEFEPANRMSDATDLTDNEGLAQSTYTSPRDEDLSVVTTSIPGLDTFLYNIYGIRYVSNSLEPKVIMRGNPVNFSVQVSNPGSVAVPLSQGLTNISFSDDEGHSYSASLTSLETIPGNTPAYTLNFAASTIDPDFKGGAYTPEIQVVGRSTFSSMNGVLLTNPGELTIGDSSITVGAVQVVGPSGINQVLQGDTQVEATVTILNAGIPLNIDPFPQTRLDFRWRNDNSLQPVNNLQRIDGNTTLPTNTPVDLKFRFDIPSNYPLGDIDVYVILSLNDANLVIDPDNPSGSFVVQSAGNATYVENSLDPGQVVELQIVNFRASFTNSGSANIVLNPSITDIAVSGMPVPAADLVSQFTLVGNSTTELAFESFTIPADVSPGFYDVRIRLYGSLVNGATFDENYTITDALEVLEGAQIVFSNIIIPEDIVRQGQNDVTIRYSVRNIGESPARLSEIEQRFKIDDEFIASNQWIETSVDPDLPQTINPGTQLTIDEIYSIQATAPIGTLFPAPVAYFQDQRTVYLPADTSQTILNNDSTEVIKPASIRIQNLFMKQNSTAPNAPVVNENQTFQMELVLENTGDDLITNTLVDLYRGSSQTPFRQLTIPNDISGGSTVSYVFDGSEATAGFIVYKALINSATDAIGNDARIDQPLNNNEDIQVQVASDLTLTPVFFQNQTENDSLIVSEDQIFTVRVNIENAGESAFDLQQEGQIVLRLPSLYVDWLSAQSPDSIKTFGETDEFVEWQLRAVNTMSAGIFEEITAALLQAPLDKNTGLAVPAAFSDLSITIRVEEKGAITSNVLSIISPAGAVDAILSSGQQFTLQASISFNASIADTGRSAQIVLPSGFQAAGGSVIYLGGESTAIQEWVVTAPENATDLQEIFVTARAYDRYSGQLLINNSAAINVEVVEKALLDLILNVEKFGGEVSDSLSVGQVFELRATLINQGDAGVGDGSHVYLQDFNLLTAFSLKDTLGWTPDTLQSITVGSPASWYLRVDQAVQAQFDSLVTEIYHLNKNLSENAAFYQRQRELISQLVEIQTDLVSTESDLRVVLTDIPDDENTGESAAVTASTFTKTVYLQEKAEIGEVQISAKDTVSTGQTFSFTVSANPTENLTNATATLIRPDGFTTTPANQVIALDANNSASWEITVPNLAQYQGNGSETIGVMISGEDRNSGNIISMGMPDTRLLTIQAKAKLLMRFEIASPKAAQTSNVLSLGQKIEINVYPDTIHNVSGLASAQIVDNGSIAIDTSIFQENIGNFQKIPGETYEKNFSELGQGLSFSLRAPEADERTVSISFRFRELPKDKNSGQDVDVDIDSGSVAIPIRVRAKEIAVSLDTLGNPSFTRGATNNLLMGFTVSNQLYEDELQISGIELKFIASGNDTTELSKLAVANMLQSVRIIDYDEFMNPTAGIVFANYVLGDTSTFELPLRVPLTELSPDSTFILERESVQQFYVLANFGSSAVSRKFRTHLTNVIAFDIDSETPVRMVDADGQEIANSNEFISNDISLLSNDPREAFHNYPNPFGQAPNEITKIRFFVENDGSDVRLRIFTLTGELVRSQWGVNLSGLPRGLYDGDVTWNGRNDRGERVLNGVYICAIEIRSGGSTKRYTRKIAYIK